jgi:hypothetical protein
MDKILNLISSPIYAQESAITGQAITLTPSTEFAGAVSLTVPSIISGLVTLVLAIAGLVAFFFLIYGGIKWITSGGDKEQTAAAQSTLTAAIIGLAIVFSTWALIGIVETFLGIKIISGLQIPKVQPPTQ